MNKKDYILALDIPTKNFLESVEDVVASNAAEAYLAILSIIFEKALSSNGEDIYSACHAYGAIQHELNRSFVKVFPPFPQISSLK